jgi:hypothetical protein
MREHCPAGGLVKQHTNKYRAKGRGTKITGVLTTLPLLEDGLIPALLVIHVHVIAVGSLSALPLFAAV